MHPDRSTRFRLVEVRSPGTSLRLGRGLACVVAPPAQRAAVARWIASAVPGPRPADLDGVVEIAGRCVSVRSLPSPLLAPSAPALVTSDLLQAQWRATCAARHDELAAQYAALRLARHRAEAALEHARRRVPALRVSSATRDDSARRARESRRRIEALLARLDPLAPVPSAAAQALADAYEAALAAEANASEHDELANELTRAEARVDAARMQLAVASGAIDPAVRAHIDALHREVVAAEAMVSQVRRKDRPAALDRYEAAVRAEREALAQAGIESYASFLVAIAQGVTRTDPEQRTRAERELAAAEAELEMLRARVRSQERPAGADDLAALVRQATELLGRPPGPDVAAELRALRVTHPDVPAVLADLHAALHAAGVEVGDDPVAAARAYLSSIPSEGAADDVTLAPTVATADDDAAARAELLAHTRARDEHDAALVRTARELARVDALRDAALHDLDADAITAAITRVLDTYRDGELLAGRLPLVFDGVLDALPASSRRAAFDALAAATDVQAIVVTADARVPADASRVGAVVRTWPDARDEHDAHHAKAARPNPQPPAPVAFFHGAAPSHAAISLTGRSTARLGPIVVPELAPGRAAQPVARTACSVHHDTLSVARCARCSRPGCIECLVYVIGEPDLWCSACAVELYGETPRSLPIADRRGA